jgi:hypothetical protein
VEIRRVIRTETTKIEALNDFRDWVSFGGPAVKSGDPVEQEKQLKYANLVRNTIMLSNVADMIGVLASMVKDGHRVTSDNLSRRAYPSLWAIRSQLDDLPGILEPRPLPFEAAL